MRRMRSIALGIACLVVFPLSVWADNPHEVVIRDGAEQPLSWDDGSPSAPAPTPSLAKQEQRASPEPSVATAAHVEAPQPLVWSAETPRREPTPPPFPRVRYQHLAQASASPAAVGTGRVRPVAHQAPVVPYTATELTPQPTPGIQHGPHCASCQCHAHEPPLGSALYAAMQAQVARGRVAGQVLYRFDFENGPLSNRSALNRYGRLKLRGLIQRMQFTGTPLYIEYVPGDRQLSEARRRHVINAAQTHLGIPLDPARVAITAERLPHLRATDAKEIQDNQRQTTRSQGTVVTGFGGGAGPVGNNAQNGRGNQR